MLKRQKGFNGGKSIENKKIKETRKGIKKHEVKRAINKKAFAGFTLIEILVVVGIIAVLASVVIVAINPARQFKLARDSQRLSNVTAILNAISQNIAEHKGLFDCPTALPSIAKTISSDISNGIDIAACLVPNYISSLPYDPSISGAKWNSITDYDTKYVVYQDAQGRIIASSTGEITANISVIR